MTYCVHCGRKQHQRARYCHYCGKRHPKQTEIEFEEEQAATFEMVDEGEAEEKIKKLLEEKKESHTSSGFMASIAVTVFVIIISFLLIGACSSH